MPHAKADRHGELLTLDDAWKYLYGEQPSQASVIGRRKLCELMRRGVIRAAMSDNGRGGRQIGPTVFTRKRYIDEFMDGLFERGLHIPDLNIEIIPFPKEANHAS